MTWAMFAPYEFTPDGSRVARTDGSSKVALNVNAADNRAFYIGSTFRT